MIPANRKLRDTDEEHPEAAEVFGETGECSQGAAVIFISQHSTTSLSFVQAVSACRRQSWRIEAIRFSSVNGFWFVMVGCSLRCGFELLSFGLDPQFELADGFALYRKLDVRVEGIHVVARGVAQPNRRIAIIVDGLDHADRISGAPTAHLATEIADELAGISLPAGAVVIVGSQPGSHLTSFLQAAAQYQAPKWSEESVRALIEKLDLKSKLQENSLGNEEEAVVHTIVEKADGSPLYATYLARTAIDIAEGRRTEASDISDYLATAPAFDDDLNRYYQWLIGPIEAEAGGLSIIQLLSLLDFSLMDTTIR